MAGRLKKDYRSRSGNVERCHLPGHRNPQQMIAGSANEVVQTGAFASQDNHGVRRELELIVILRAAFVEAHAPQIALLQSFQRTHHVDDSRDAQMLGCAGRGLDRDRTEGSRAPFGEDNPVHARSFGRSQQRSQVLRVFDAVESQDQTRLGPIEQVFEFEKLALADDGHHALMGSRPRHTGERFARLEAGLYARGTAKVENLAKALVVALPGEANVIETAQSGTERFFDRVQAVQDFHLTQFKHFRSPCGVSECVG